MAPIEPVAISLQLDVPVTMRDGTVLRADIYAPSGTDAVPVLVMRHPYSKSRTPAFREVDVTRVVRAGYIVVIQDVRGRYASDGTFVPSIHEIDDGVDTVAWAAGLPGSSGVVGMWGMSYAAETQWSAALGGATQLRSLLPVNSPSHSHFNGYQMRGGAHELGNRLGWWHRAVSFEQMRRARPEEGLPDLVARYEHTQRLLDSQQIYRLRPFIEQVAAQAETLAPGTEIFTLDAGDPSRQVTMTAGRYDEIAPPAFLIGGWFDCFLGSTISQYLGMKAAAESRGTRAPHLMMGPWSHRMSDYRLGDVIFGLNARAALPVQDVPLTGQILRWLDATLKGDEAALAGVPPVRLYLMGSNTWLGFAAYPPPAETREWYLAKGAALAAEPSADASDVQYDYDPENPVPTRGGATLLAAEFPEGPRAQDPLYERDDVVVFTSDPLASPMHVVGRVTATINVVTDAVDTDFVVSLSDVHPDGRSILVVDGIQRLSARNSFTVDGEYIPGAENPPVPGQDVELRIGLLDTAHTFAAGHRLRVAITSSNFPRWDPNPNTGSTIFDSAESVVAHQTVRFGGRYASRIELPVLSDDVVAGAVLAPSEAATISHSWED